MKFVKMQGIGNDYVYFDAFSRPAIEKRFIGAGGAKLIRRISDRHTGVGGDGVILVCKPTASGKAQDAAVRMRMFNSDGSEGEMCGNGVRCVAKFAHDRLRVRGKPMLVETGRGVLSIAYEVSGGRLKVATVDMGEPILEASKVPVTIRGDGAGENPIVDLAIDDPGAWFGTDWDWKGAGVEPRITCVSMGNPHVVIFCADPAKVPLWQVGPRIETHAVFPRRVNVHFVSAGGGGRGVMRTWERGAGETQACGTGACAVLVAGVLNNRLRRTSTLQLPGGPLKISWEKKSNHVFMTGPAEDVFEGEWRDKA